MCSICVNLISAQEKASQLTNYKPESMVYTNAGLFIINYKLKFDKIRTLFWRSLQNLNILKHITSFFI